MADIEEPGCHASRAWASVASGVLARSLPDHPAGQIGLIEVAPYERPSVGLLGSCTG